MTTGTTVSGLECSRRRSDEEVPSRFRNPPRPELVCKSARARRRLLCRRRIALIRIRRDAWRPALLLFANRVLNWRASMAWFAVGAAAAMLAVIMGMLVNGLTAFVVPMQNTEASINSF